MVPDTNDKPKETETARDADLDVSMAVTKAQEIMRKIVGNLQQKEFKLESIEQNGTNTRYIVICSIVPDIGKERDFYFIKIDVETGKLVPPMGTGKLEDNKIVFHKIDVQNEWLE